MTGVQTCALPISDGLGPYRLAESEWRITKDTHKAIVTEDDFGLVREILKIRKKRYETLHAPDGAVIRPENLLKGKVFCGDCLVPAARTGSNHRKKTGKIRIYRYRCRTYKEKGTQECTSKSISEGYCLSGSHGVCPSGGMYGGYGLMLS